MAEQYRNDPLRQDEIIAYVICEYERLFAKIGRKYNLSHFLDHQTLHFTLALNAVMKCLNAYDGRTKITTLMGKCYHHELLSQSGRLRYRNAKLGIGRDTWVHKSLNYRMEGKDGLGEEFLETISDENCQMEEMEQQIEFETAINKYLKSGSTTSANKELVRLLAEGRTYAEIAEILGVNKRALYRRAQDIRRRMEREAK